MGKGIMKFKEWLAQQPSDEKEEIKSLLGNQRQLIEEGLFVGTAPRYETRGMNFGPAPSGNKCPMCGK